MPKISVQVGKRVRIDCNYEDYKSWEILLRKALEDKFTETTTKTESGEYWKAITFVVGETEYKIVGSVMPIYVPDCNKPLVD